MVGMQLASNGAHRNSEVHVESTPKVNIQNRLGLHYFPDTLHYRTQDLEIWLPELEKMGIGWLTLLAPLERAIPEYFLHGLVDAGIQPILHFQIPTNAALHPEIPRLLLRSYAKWGIKHAVFFDKPNSRTSWSASDWVQMDLVERFLDLFIPVSETAIDEGLIPIFPPLEPGGDYWDLSFLESSLQILQRRGRVSLLNNLALSACAWIGCKPISWGIGGPQRWPNARPYFTPSDSQDHLGFRIFDWYEALAQRQLGTLLPIFLLRSGATPKDFFDPKTGQPDWNAHADSVMAAISLLRSESNQSDIEGESLDQVVACCLWLLAADKDSRYADQSWFQDDGRLPLVNSLYRLHAHQHLVPPKQAVSKCDDQITGSSGDSMPLIEVIPETSNETAEVNGSQPADEIVTETVLPEEKNLEQQLEADTFEPDEVPVQEISDRTKTAEEEPDDQNRPISHYVLLPLYAWGAADWDLSAIQPLLLNSHPTVGFSLTEARLAEKVTIIGGEGAVSSEALEMLRSAGCLVERVLDDGTLFAS